MNKLAIFSSCIAVAGIGLYLVNQNNKNQCTINLSEKQIIEKALLIKILKDLQKQYYPLWEKMIECGKQQYHLYINKNNENQKDILREFIETKFQYAVEKVEQGVFIKYNVSQNQVNYNCKSIYKDDDQINALLNYINLGFEQVMKLELNLPPNIDLPEFINQEVILKTQCQIFISSAQLFNQKIQEHAQLNGGVKVTKHSNAFQQILAELKQNSKKEEILYQNGFDSTDEAGSKLFFDALTVYQKQRSFKQKLVKLNEIYDQIMSEILENGSIIENQIENRLKC